MRKIAIDAIKSGNIFLSVFVCFQRSLSRRARRRRRITWTRWWRRA
jgi:hypothetical protein